MSQLQSELQAAVRARDFTGLRESFKKLPPSEIANLICRIHTDDQALLFRVLPRDLASKTFEYLPRAEQEELIKSMGQEEVAAILNSMADDDRTTLLEELPGAVTKQLLALLSDEERASAVKLLGYPDSSVGRLMTPHYIAVQPGWTVQEVLDYVRANGQDSETLNMVYVVDEGGMLVDDIRMRGFLLAPLSAHVSDLMDNRYDALKATDDHQTAATLVIRAMALGEVRLRDWWRVMRREVFSGLVLGGVLGVIGFLRITVWSAFTDIYGEHWLLVALTIGISLVGIVLWGTLSGSMLPLLLRRVGLDPATSSAPFVATLVDVPGLIIYFSVAMLILRGTLL